MRYEIPWFNLGCSKRSPLHFDLGIPLSSHAPALQPNHYLLFITVLGVVLASVGIDSYYKLCTTLSNGYLGFRIDDERSKLRLLSRIAELSESSNLRTHLAPSSSSEYGCARPIQFHLHLSQPSVVVQALSVSRYIYLWGVTLNMSHGPHVMWVRNSIFSVSSTLARHRIDQCFAPALTSERKGDGTLWEDS